MDLNFCIFDLLKRVMEVRRTWSKRTFVEDVQFWIFYYGRIVSFIFLYFLFKLCFEVIIKIRAAQEEKQPQEIHDFWGGEPFCIFLILWSWILCNISENQPMGTQSQGTQSPDPNTPYKFNVWWQKDQDVENYEVACWLKKAKFSLLFIPNTHCSCVNGSVLQNR